MLDVEAWADDAPLYYARLRSEAIPNGVAQYGDEPQGGGGKAESKPPISLGAFEASEREAVALWRVLAHLGASRPFDPYMRAQGRRVVGLKMLDEPEYIVECMAEDVIAYLELAGEGEVPERTLSFCHKARSQSMLIVGDLSEPVNDWIGQDEAIAQFGLNFKSLWWRRKNGLVEFRVENGEFFYSRSSLAED